MSRTAEVIYVGDAESLLRANRAALSSTETTEAGIRAAGKRTEASYLSMSGAGKKAAGELEKSHSRIVSSLTGIGKSTNAAAAGIVAIGAAVYGVKKSADTTAELAKETLTLHNVTGLSVKSASTYSAVAQAQGINVKGLNQAFGTLSKNLHAVESGHEGSGKTAKKQEEALRQLGIPLGAVLRAHGDMNKLLPLVTAAFERMPGSVQKTALGMALFGRGWQTLVPLMHQGELGLKEQMKTAERMGATLGGKSVKSLKDFQRAQEESKYASLGLQLAIGQYLAPALTKLVIGFGKVAHAVGEGIHWLQEHKEAAKVLGHVLEVVLGGALLVYAHSKATKFIDATKEMIGSLKTFADKITGTTGVVAKESAAQASTVQANSAKIATANEGAAGSFAGTAGAAEKSAAGVSTAEAEMVAAVEAANAKIEASNVAAAGSFGGVLGKLGKLGGLLAAGAVAGSALAEGGGNTSELERTLEKENPDKETMFGHKNPFYKHGAGLTGANVNASYGVSRVGTLGASNQYPYVSGVARRFGLDPNTLWGVYGTETTYGKNISTSSAGAMGAFQFIPETAKTYGYPLTNHPNQRQFEAQTEAAARYLSVLIRENHGNVDAAVAQYSGHTPGYAQKVASHGSEAHGSGASPAVRRVSIPAEYLSPFGPSSHLVRGREDEGIDFSAAPGSLIKAIGAGIIDKIIPNWFKGQPLVEERLTSGSHKGQYIYYAEQLSPSVREGQRIAAGQSIGTVAAHGTGLELGFGAGGGRTLAQATTGYTEGQKTPAAEAFSRFLGSVGKTGTALQVASSVFEKAAAHLTLSAGQARTVRGFSAQAGEAHADAVMNAAYATGAGSAWERARGLQVARAKPLGTAVGNRDMTLIDTQDVLTAKQQKVYYEREVRALKRDVQAWKKLRASYLKFARHAFGNAKKEALDKAAAYAGKIKEAEAQIKELGGTIADTDAAIEQSETTLTSTLPGEIQGADLNAYQAANAKIDMEVRAGVKTAAEGKTAKENNAQGALTGAFGALSPEGVLQVKGDLREFQEAVEGSTDALKAHTDALEASAKALAEFTHVANQIGLVEAGSLSKSLADTISGQIAGVDYHGQRMTAGVGTAARY